MFGYVLRTVLQTLVLEANKAMHDDGKLQLLPENSKISLDAYK